MCGAVCLAVGPMLTHVRLDVSDGIPTLALKTATTSHSMSPLFLPWFIWAPASGPSAAAAVIHGGGANGLTAWKDASGKSLKEIEEN